MQTVAVIEARMGSSRLPGKVLMDIGGESALEVLCRRLGKAKRLDDIVIATSTHSNDDAIEEFGRTKGVKVFRGSEEDVLGRVVGAANFADADVIVEITGDCPLIDPLVVDYVAGYFLDHYPDYDFVTNIGYVENALREIPVGMDVRVFAYKDLLHISGITNDPEDREHVSLYFFRTGKDKYKLKQLPTLDEWKREYQARLTLDTKEDLEFISAVHKSLSYNGNHYGLSDILTYLDSNLELLSINSEVQQKKVTGID